MYLHLGQNTVIRKDIIVGIFDLDNSTVSKKTRDYLAVKEKSGQVVTVGYDLPKSFVVCVENGQETVYISQLSASTLTKRYSENGGI